MLTWLLAITVLVAGCGKAHDDKLPPASGSAAPALPTLPAMQAPTAPARTSLRKATGTLLPHAEVAVVARARGVIVALDVDVGAQVAKGQTLFRIDDREAGLRLAQARTQRAAAAQQLASTEVEYRRTQRLFDQKAASPQQWDQITAQLEAAKVGVAQADNGVALASKAVADTTATAPIAGVVVTRHVAQGDYVSDAPPTQVLVLQDQTTLDLKFRLPERALASVRVGDPISVALPALGVTRTATIAIVAPSVDPRTRTVELTARLANADHALRSGLMAEIELTGAIAAAGSEH